MAIQIGRHNFDGPHTNTSAIRALSGVYAVLGRTGVGQWFVVDIGESANMRERLDTHDRRDVWQRQGHGELAAAALYVAEPGRMLIERELRTFYNPPCGDR